MKINLLCRCSLAIAVSLGAGSTSVLNAGAITPALQEQEQSLGEFKEYVAEKLPEWSDEQLDLVAKLVDVNEDGTISESEFEERMDAVGQVMAAGADDSDAMDAEETAGGQPAIGETAPEIEGVDTEGVAFKLSEYRGQVVMLDFWGDWWGPCRAMYPHERSLVKQLAGHPFEIVGVNSDDDLDDLKKIVEEQNITWRSFQNEREDKPSISDDWDVNGWPTIYVIDHEGVIRYKDVRGEKLDKAIETLLSEMGHEVSISHEEEEPEDKAAGSDSIASGFSFESPVQLKAGGDAIRVEEPGYASPAMADMDGDGKKDLLIGQFNEGKINVYRNLGDQNFDKGEWLQAGGDVATIPGVWWCTSSTPQVVDLNGDGNMDILSGSYSRMDDDKPMAGLFQVLWGENGGKFKTAETLTGIDGEPLLIVNGEIDDEDVDSFIKMICTRPTAADLNGDGHLDIVAGNAAGTFYFFEGRGKGRFVQEAKVIDGLQVNGSSDPVVVDFDGDGDLDIVSGSSEGGVMLALNQGSKSEPAFREFVQLVEAFDYESGTNTLGDEHIDGPCGKTRVFVDDLNGDGMLDLIVGDSVNMTYPADGVDKSEVEEKLAAWQAKMDDVDARIQPAMDALFEEYGALAGKSEDDDNSELQAELEKKMDALYADTEPLYEEREKIVQDVSTGFVWVYYQANNTAADATAEQTASEFKEYVAGKLSDLNDDQLDEIVKRVDADGDGTISGSEFKTRMEAVQSVMSGGTDADESEETPDVPQPQADPGEEVEDKAGETESATAEIDAESFEDMITRVVVVKPFVESGNVPVLLITADELAADWIPFAKWKTQNGKLTKIVTVGQIGLQYEADSIQEKIRLCVRNHIDEFNTRWVILGGDCEPRGKGLVPGGHRTRHRQERRGIPTDIVYLSETNWDADGDGKYGEFEDDRDAISYPDGSVGLGRIPVRTAEDIAAFTEKVIAYESRYPTSGFAENMIYTCTDDPAYPKVRNSWDGYLSKVWDGEVGRFFSNETPWDQEDEPGSHDLSADNLVELINRKTTGKFHIHGHGHLSAWVLEKSTFTATHVSKLENEGAYPLFTTVSCNTGEYDSRKDPSIVEQLLRAPRAGSVAVVAPIRTGKPHFASNSDFELMVSEGKLDGTTMTMTNYWSFGLGDGASTGHAMMMAKDAMASEAAEVAGFHLCICELNLLGDPTLDMRATSPRQPELSVSIDQTDSVIEVFVETDAPGSTVCIWNHDDVYEVATADESGNATFEVNSKSLEFITTVSGAGLNSISTRNAEMVTTPTPESSQDTDAEETESRPQNEDDETAG